MSDVFISYSRKDIAFARLIREFLQASQIDTWIDWERIPVGERWWDEICQSIENANVFMFIISKNSIGSSVCKNEIDHALKNHKRIIPIIVDALKPDVIQDFAPELPQFNWIIFERDHIFRLEENPEIKSDNPEDSLVALPKLPQFEQALERLSVAIHTDWEWVKYHTRLQLDALRWEANGRNSSYLVLGAALNEAEQQLLRAAGKDPLPTGLQIEYTTASRQEDSRRQQEQLKLEQKARQRQRIVIWAVGIGLTAAIVLGILAWGQRNQYLSETHVRATAEVNAINQQTTAEAASTLAVQQSNEAQRQATIALSGQLSAQSQSQLSHQLDLAMLLAGESYLTADTYNSRNSLLLALEQSPQLARIYRYTEHITALAFTPDGKELAAAGCTERDAQGNVCLQNEIVFYDLAGGQTGRVLAAAGGRLLGLAFTPDGSVLFAANAGDRVYRYDLSSAGQPAASPLPAFDESSASVVISPDGHYMASGGCHAFSIPGGWCDKGGIVLWDLSTVNPSGLLLKGVGPQMHNLAFSPQSDLLYAGDCAGMQTDSCHKGEVKSWNLADGSMQEHAIEGTTSAIISIDVSADGKLLAAGDATGVVHIINLANWKQVSLFEQQLESDGLLFSRSSSDQILASLSFGSPIEIHSAFNTVDEFTLEPYQTTQFVDAMAISPDGRTLASSSCATAGISWYDCKEGQIYLWNLFSWQPAVQTYSGSDSSPWNYWRVGFDPSAPEKPIVVAANTNKIVVWDVKENQPSGQPFTTAPDVNISDVFLSHSGKVLVYSELIGYVESTRMHFLDVATRQEIDTPVMIDGWILNANFSPDDRWMVSDGPDGTFLVWDTTSGQVVRQMTMDLNPGYISLAFSPDGKTLAAAGCIKGIQSCQTYRIEMFDLQTGKPTGKSIEGSTDGEVRQLIFSPDGKKIGVSTFKSLHPYDTWWDIESGQPDPQLNNQAVEWNRSPDGRYAVTITCEIGNGSSCGVGLITLWDVQKGQPIGQPMRDPESSVAFQGFSPDGKFLYTSSVKKMTVWSLDPADWLKSICHIANRNLTPQEWSLYLDQAVYNTTCKLAP